MDVSQNAKQIVKPKMNFDNVAIAMGEGLGQNIERK
jgi:hypothetical protein